MKLHKKIKEKIKNALVNIRKRFQVRLEFAKEQAILAPTIYPILKSTKEFQLVIDEKTGFQTDLPWRSMNSIDDFIK